MKQYSFVQEFTGNCAAGMTAYESPDTSGKKPVTSIPMDSLLKKPKADRGKQTIRSLVFKKTSSPVS